ncbi:MAG TPA: hypothetical protein VHX86_19475 [Tepidisphaeraceae bacterium]|jgi:hypothetical protein|nr:hypothetical protein [Tepidisphaeraceae bacterium]
MIGWRNTICGAVLAILICVVGAWGAATGAAAQSATAPAPHKAQVPPGFVVVKAGGRSVFCEPRDQAWVQDTLASIAPATRPTTMPSDIVTRTQQHRKELVDQMMRDLDLTDGKPIDELLDNKLLPALQRIGAVNPTIFYLVATHQKLIDLMEAGWTDPRFHYNRYAQDVSYTPSAILSPDKPIDDLVWWVEVRDGDNAATRRDALVADVRFFEAELINHNSLAAENEAEHDFEQFIHDKVFAPLKLPRREDWFDFAGSNMFAIKYAAMVTGIPRRTWTEQLIGRPGQKRPFLQLDLINTMDPATIRPEYLGAYDRMLVLKGSVVIDSWLGSVGDDALAKVLPTLRSHPPQTQQELIDDVKKATGYDLRPLMQGDFGSPSTRQGSSTTP